MDITVVVPTWNRRETVTRTLKTLFAQSAAAEDYEVIAVVDGSTDGTADALHLLRPACRFRVIEQANRGPASARNAGYREAKADLVLFLDDDMLCDSGLVMAHVAAHKQLHGSVAFGALFLSADSPQSLATECFNREIGAIYLERRQDPGREWQITDCVFSNASMSRALLEEFGGFDERFRKREDLELGTRLFGAGVRAQYVSSAVAYQYYEKRPDDLIREAEAYAVADVLLAREHRNVFIKGQLNWLAKNPGWKRRALHIAASVPWLADFLLVPICGLGEAGFRVSAFRNLGVRALQMRRRIRWYRKAVEAGWKPELLTAGAV